MGSEISVTVRTALGNGADARNWQKQAKRHSLTATAKQRLRACAADNRARRKAGGAPRAGGTRCPAPEPETAGPSSCYTVRFYTPSCSRGQLPGVVYSFSRARGAGTLHPATVHRPQWSNVAMPGDQGSLRATARRHYYHRQSSELVHSQANTHRRGPSYSRRRILPRLPPVPVPT